MKTNFGQSQETRDEPDQPVSASEFRNAVQQYDGDTITEKIGNAVDAVWPAPDYREHQRETVIEIIETFYVDDKDVCLLSAPTGAGKSLLIYAVASVVNEVTGRRAFTTTPLNTLIDQIDNDDFLEDVITVKGRNNYECIHPQDAGAPVDEAICQRQSDFDCQYKDKPHTSGGCPYYGRVYKAQTKPNVVTNLSYLMANSMIPDVADAGFASRELMAVDECIPEGETVVTSGGRRVEIERFKCEEPVSVDTSSGTLETDSLINMKQTATKECVRVHATRGSFMASHDHQMKDTGGWTDAADADRVARPLCRVSKRPKAEARAALLGYWFGDGWVSTSTGVSGDVVDLKRIDDDVELVYDLTHTSERSEETSGSVEPVNGSRHSIDGQSNTYNYPRELAEMLKNDGLVSGDKTVQDCHVPHFDTASETKAFIAGFFGAEGMVPSQASDRCFNVIKASRYTTGNCVFFEEMKEALDSFGISSYIDQTEGNVRKDGTETTCYELVIGSGRENLHRFLDEIGFEYCRRKEIRAEKIRCYLSEYLNELERWQDDYAEIVEAVEDRDREYGAVTEEVEKRGYGERMKRYVSSHGEPSEIRDFPTYGKWVEQYVEGDVVYENVEKVEWIGERECYDIEVSDNHNFLVGDEYLAHNCQNVDDFALMFVGFTVSPHTVPIDFDTIQNMPTEGTSQEHVIEWLEEEVMLRVTEKLEELEAKEDSMLMSEKEQEQLEDLRRFNQKVANFMADVKDNHWAMNFDDFGSERKIEFEPIKVGRFLHKYLWGQSHKVLAASATIPPNFVEEVGLDDKDIGRVEVESTFPPERRPVITSESVGKMSYHERDETLPKMADQIGRIADVWDGHKGFVHCHSYSIAEKIYDRLPYDVQKKTRLQDADDREGSLQDWMDAPVHQTGQYSDQGGQVFLSVAMNEGISLDDDLTRWQVVAKCAYPHMKDERVSYRMDEDTMGGTEWNWYSSQAAVNLQQAIGRGMRSKDDWVANYILDDSAVNLIERNEHLFEDWFLDAVDIEPDQDVVCPDNDPVEDTGVDRKQEMDEDDSLDEIADEYFG